MARTKTLPPVRISEPGWLAIESLRGGWSISEYVRQALADAVKAGKRGPKVTYYL